MCEAKDNPNELEQDVKPKPCPCCHREPVVTQMGSSWFVHCALHSCNWGHWFAADSRQKAINAWNRKVESA